MLQRRGLLLTCAPPPACVLGRCSCGVHRLLLAWAGRGSRVGLRSTCRSCAAQAARLRPACAELGATRTCAPGPVWVVGAGLAWMPAGMPRPLRAWEVSSSSSLLGGFRYRACPAAAGTREKLPSSAVRCELGLAAPCAPELGAQGRVINTWADIINRTVLT